MLKLILVFFFFSCRYYLKSLNDAHVDYKIDESQLDELAMEVERYAQVSHLGTPSLSFLFDFFFIFFFFLFYFIYVICYFLLTFYCSLASMGAGDLTYFATH